MAAEKQNTSPVGDVIFFLVLLFTAAMAYSLVRSFISLLPALSLSRLIDPAIAFLMGCAVARYLIRGHVSVFIHELKHMIASLLAGNAPRGMRVNKESGHYEYAYTEDTASFNAFIALAPYYLPLFTAIFLGSSLYPLWGQADILKIILCLGYGIDLVLCVRDISPLQTDFSKLRGGFGLGFLYVCSIHTIFITVILCWLLGDLAALEQLFQGAFKSFMSN